MALNEAALRKLGKEEIINLALEYQSKFDSTLSSINDIKTDLSELRKYYEKLESDVIITKRVNTNLCDKMKFLEHQCWANEQYSRRECLEITGVPESVTDNDLEVKVLKLLEKIDVEIVEVHPDHIEACHWIKSNAELKKVIKMTQRKDTDKIRRAKKKQKDLDLSSIGINSAVYINDSLCRYYKNLWAKCKKLWLNKFIHGFWTSNGSIRLELTETGNVRVITHDVDLEELFPGNELISDDTR